MLNTVFMKATSAGPDKDSWDLYCLLMLALFDP